MRFRKSRKLGAAIVIFTLMLTLLWPVQLAIEADSSNIPYLKQKLKDALISATKSAAIQFNEEALHEGKFAIDATKALEAFRTIMENNLKVDASTWVPKEGSVVPSSLHVKAYLYNDWKEKSYPGSEKPLMEEGDLGIPLVTPSITVKKPTILASASFVYNSFWGKKVVVSEYASAQVTQKEADSQSELILPQIKISFFTDKNGHYQVPVKVQNLGDGLFLASAMYTVRPGETRLRALDIVVDNWGLANYMDVKLGGENTLPIQETDLSDLLVYNGTDGDQFLVNRQPDGFYRVPKMGRSQVNQEIVMHRWYSIQDGQTIKESFLFRMGESTSIGVRFGMVEAIGGNAPPFFKTGTISGGGSGGTGTTYTFNYTGSVQTWKVPYTGRYKLEVWGADGGYTGQGPRDNGDRPLGGYIAGEVTLNANEILYIYVGGNGLHGGWNGGGAGTSIYSTGGGATDIRRNGNTLNHRIIAAGGGGGTNMKPNNYGLLGEGGYGGERIGYVGYGGKGCYYPSSTRKCKQVYNGANPESALGQGEPGRDGYEAGGGGGWYGGYRGKSRGYLSGDVDSGEGGGGGSNGYDPSQVQLLESVRGSNKGIVDFSYSLDGIAKITALTDPLNVNWDTNNTFPTPFTKGETKSVTLRLSNPSNGVTWNPTNTSIKVEWRRASDNLLIQAPTYPVSTTVNPGGTLQQNLNIQAPSTAGTYNVIYKLVDGAEAETTQTFYGIEVKDSFKVDWDGMNTFPSVLLQGGNNSVSVKMTNPTGTTWAPSNVKINLEWRRKTDNVLMYTLSVPISASVSPGGSHQQTITFATPNLPVGNYRVTYNLINTALGMGGDKVQTFDVSIGPSNKIEGVSLVDVARSSVPIQLPQSLPSTKPIPIKTGYNLTLHVPSRGTGTMRLELFSGGQAIPIGKDLEVLPVLEFPILDGGGYVTFFIPTTVKDGTIIDVRLTEITRGATGDILTVYLANRSFEVYGVAYQDMFINRTN